MLVNDSMDVWYNPIILFMISYLKNNFMWHPLAAVGQQALRRHRRQHLVLDLGHRLSLSLLNAE